MADEPRDLAPSASAVGAHVLRLQEPDGARRICQFLVHGSDAALIVDAGLPGSAERSILPALRGLPGGVPRRVVLLLTHPDSDHCGGTSELAAALPKLEVIVPPADRAALGDPERTLALRYRAFADEGVEPDAAGLERTRGRLGGPFAITGEALEGDELDLGGVTCSLVHL